ncbi:MAG: hypothetical protein R3E04_09960 [Sphingobium sp.]
MKQGRSNQSRSRQHTATPSVICLPPPKPPATLPRKEPEVLRALPLIEPEYFAQPPAAKPVGRKARRKSRKGQSKASRRKPYVHAAAKISADAVKPPECKPISPKEERASAAAATPQQSVAASHIHWADETLFPLPRNLSLALPKRDRLVALGRWMRKMIMKRRPSAPSMHSASAIEQITSLRDEVAHLQKTLDRLLARSARTQ